MCTTCGCGGDGAKIEGVGHEHGHVHPHAEGGHTHGTFRGVRRHAHAQPEPGEGRMIQLEQDLLAKNNAFAAENRTRWQETGVFALNLVSSPGSGKTTLLTATIERLKERVKIAVVEGDQQTSFDADRIRATGVPAIQINTGKGCHLDAHMVGHAMEKLGIAENSVLMIENVGNLVCPAGFDLGEAHKVVILSVTEGEDKPFKYPDMFAAADLMILNKIDLLPYVSFNVEACIQHALSVNPTLQVMKLSATTGENLQTWIDWIEAGVKGLRQGKEETIAVLKQRIAELEAQLGERAR
jgi:hydrogenase nickel incorporation protein HypB